MNFEVLTLFPHSLEPIFGASILGRASAKGVISVNCTDIRDYTKDKHRKVDDKPYGGGTGMVMQAQPVYDCIKAIAAKHKKSPRIIYMTPKGKTLTQELVKDLAEEVREEREPHKTCLSAAEGVSVNTILREIIDKEAYKEDYKNTTRSLLFTPVSYDTAISALEQLIEANIFE